MSRTSSLVWDYFSSAEGNLAECLICHKKYSRKGRGTTSLRNHLQSIHASEFKELVEKEERKSKTTAEKLQKKLDSSTPLQKAKVELKQSSLSGYWERAKKWNISDPRSLKYDFLIGEMLALDDLPFSHVEDLGFVRLIQQLTPQYILKKRKYFRSNILPRMYGGVSRKVSNILNDLNSLCFTTDVWSNLQCGISLLSLTCHGIAKDFERKSIVLSAEQLEARHTGEFISERFKIMLEKWGIEEEKVHVVVRDAGANMKKALLLSDVQNVDCACHKLQLVITDSLKLQRAVGNLTAKCKRIATHFDHSTAAQEELKKAQIRLGKPVLKILQDCPTRWNSTYYMLKRIIELREPLSLYSASTKAQVPQINNQNDWIILENLVAILKPFEEITRKLSDPKTTIADVIPLFRILQTVLSDTIAEKQQLIGTMCQSLLNELERRFMGIKTNKIYTIATFLDPRYKSKFFETKFVSENLLNEIASECSISSETDEGSYPPAKKLKLFTSDKPLCSKTLKACLEDYLLSSSSDNEEEGSSEPSDKFTKILESVKQYNQEKRIPPTDNVFDWWKANQNRYPLLSNLARKYLACPATSVLSEQLFSGAGIIYDPLRNRLKGEAAEKLLFVKYNLPLVKFNYALAD